MYIEVFIAIDIIVVLLLVLVRMSVSKTIKNHEAVKPLLGVVNPVKKED